MVVTFFGDGNTWTNAKQIPSFITTESISSCPTNFFSGVGRRLEWKELLYQDIYAVSSMTRFCWSLMSTLSPYKTAHTTDGIQLRKFRSRKKSTQKMRRRKKKVGNSF